jgi:hypothetical protein
MPRISRTILSLSLLLTAHTAMAIEEPDYEVVREGETYELRRYAPYLIAETRVEGTFDSARNEAFRRLFRYISGNNLKVDSKAGAATSKASGAKIPMTAPVVSTTPISDGEAVATFVTYFVMPASYTFASLPRPEDERITLREVPGRVVAAHRYAGRWTEGNYRKHEQRLLDALRADGIEPTSAPMFAAYNAPFVPAFMRRNEVLVEVAIDAPTGSAVDTGIDRGEAAIKHPAN